jgi:hypothetical protein
MMGVLMIKYLIVSTVWTVGWVFRLTYTDADVNPKNLGIVLAPWIIVLSYLLLFWWG